MAISPNGHFIKWSFHQTVISSNGHFFKWVCLWSKKLVPVAALVKE
jgi:hypothetical protein